jgi:hypothetical protein
MRNSPLLILRTSALVAIFVLVASVSSLAAPTPVQAGGWPVFDALNFVKNTLTSVASNVLAGMSNPLTVKEYVLDGVARVVTQAAVASLVHGVVNWANNGFNGSPAFVVNIGVHLGNVSDITASGFFTQLTGLSLNSPFQAQISSALQQQYYKSTAGNSFFLLNQCTLGDASSAVSASGYDFNKGGLSGWFNFSTQPQNNPYGLYFAAQDELNSRLGSAIQQTKDEIAQNHGFLSWRGDCNLQGVAAPTIDATAPELSQNPDGTYNVVSEGTVTVKDNGTNCLSYDVVTPGSVIENQLEKSLGSGVDSLISSDEINEIVSALAQGLISNVLGGGGLAGTSRPQGGGRDYFTQTAAVGDAAASSASVTSNLLTSIKDERAQLTQYQTNLGTINTAALGAQSAATTAANNGHFCTFSEGSSASDVLVNVVNPIVDNSNTALANTATSLSTLTNIQSAVESAKDSGAVANATLNYQNFLTSDTTPSATDMGNAQAQSADLGVGVLGTTTPAGPTTLVTELHNITAEANACTH